MLPLNSTAIDFLDTIIIPENEFQILDFSEHHNNYRF